MKVNLEKIDNICDYIPVISTVSNLTNLFQKYVLLNLQGVKSSPIPKKDYYVHIQKKSNFRTVALLIPFIGNFIVALHDYRQKAAVQKADQAVVHKANELASIRNFEEAIQAARQITNEQLKQTTLTSISNKMLEETVLLYRFEEVNRAETLANQIPDNNIKQKALDGISSRVASDERNKNFIFEELSKGSTLHYTNYIHNVKLKQLIENEIENCKASINLIRERKFDEASEFANKIITEEIRKSYLARIEEARNSNNS